jgi:hypothetical protein
VADWRGFIFNGTDWRGCILTAAHWRGVSLMGQTGEDVSSLGKAGWRRMHSGRDHDHVYTQSYMNKK